MDSLIAIKGRDFVIVAADTTNAYSVLRMKVPPKPLRTSTIRSGTSMDRNCWPSVVSTPTSSSSATTSRRIWLSWSTRTATDSPLTIPRSSFARNWQKPSARDHTASTASSQDSRETSPDCTGSTILDQSLRRARQHTDMLNIWPHPSWTPSKLTILLRRKDSRPLRSASIRWGTDSWLANLPSPSRLSARTESELWGRLSNPKGLFDCWISQFVM